MMYNKEKELQNWTKEKVKLNEKYASNSEKIDKKHLCHGMICYAKLGVNLGHEYDKQRPVIIISSDKYLSLHNGLCTIIPLSSKIKYKDPNKRIPKYNTEYILRKDNYDFLKLDSSVKIDQIRTISVVRIESGRYAMLSENDLNIISEKLKLYLDIQ